ADYWEANVRHPVRFSQAISTAADNHATFIEISPHPLLSHAITDTVATTHHHIIGTLWRDGDDTISFHTNLNTTHTSHPPETPHPPEPHPALPTTPWRHTHHWITVPTPATQQAKPVRQGGGSGAEPDGAEWGYELTWPVRPLSAAETTAGSSWLVLADPDLAPETSRALGADSRVVVLAPSVLAEDVNGTALLDALGGVSNVLYAPDLSSNHFNAESGCALFNAARRLTAALASTAPPPRLFMLTPKAQAISEDDWSNPAHAVLWGLGRVLALQHPEIWGGVVNLDDSVPAECDDNVDSAAVPAGEIKDTWRQCEPEQRRTLLRDHVGMLVAAVMGLPSWQSLNPSADFFELGMDSLMSVILRRALGESLGEALPTSVVFDYPTVEALADYLATIADADQQGVDAYEDLTESDLSERVS
ncbi:MAG: acyltransferase domain-containing protein, partial [Mycobacterium sp.]